MKGAYPIVISKEVDGYFVSIPDFGIETQGKTIPDAMEMARDAIGLMAIDYEDDGQPIPKPNTVPYEKREHDIETLVDVNFTEYRRQVDRRAVKKNCTLPNWLNVEAEKAGLNFSKLLQEAIANKLGISLQ